MSDITPSEKPTGDAIGNNSQSSTSSEKTGQANAVTKRALFTRALKPLTVGLAAIVGGSKAPETAQDLVDALKFSEGTPSGENAIRFISAHHSHETSDAARSAIEKGDIGGQIGGFWRVEGNEGVRAIQDDPPQIIAADSIIPQIVDRDVSIPEEVSKQPSVDFLANLLWMLPVDPRTLPDGKVDVLAADVVAPYSLPALFSELAGIDNTRNEKAVGEFVKGATVAFLEHALYATALLVAIEKIAPQLSKQISRRNLFRGGVLALSTLSPLALAASSEVSTRIKNETAQNVANSLAFLNQAPVVGDDILWANMRTALIDAKLEEVMRSKNQTKGAMVMGSGHGPAAPGILEDKEKRQQTIRDGAKVLLGELDLILSEKYPNLSGENRKIAEQILLTSLSQYEVYSVNLPKQDVFAPQAVEGVLRSSIVQTDRGESQIVKQALLGLS